MANAWFRFYSESLRHPKVAKLTDKQFRFWVELLSVASQNDGLIPPLDTLKHVLKTRLDHASRAVEDLLRAELIDALDGGCEHGYKPHNWEKYQYKSDTSRERVAKHREKVKQESNVTCNGFVTPQNRNRTETEQNIKPIDTNVSMSSDASLPADGDLFDLPKNEIPPCPHQEILKLYKTILPELPQPRAWNPNDAKTLAARWKWILTSHTDEGVRRASSKDEGLSWMEFFFTIVKESDFLMGRVKDPRKFEIRWLINPTNFDKVLSGKYDNKDGR